MNKIPVVPCRIFFFCTDAVVERATGDQIDNATIVNGSNFGNSQGSGSNNNVYHDGSNYVIENQTGSDGQEYTVVGVEEV